MKKNNKTIIISDVTWFRLCTVKPEDLDAIIENIERVTIALRKNKILVRIFDEEEGEEAEERKPLGDDMSIR